jgi:hypothetical protein
VPVGQLLRSIAALRGLLPCTAARTAQRSARQRRCELGTRWNKRSLQPLTVCGCCSLRCWQGRRVSSSSGSRRRRSLRGSRALWLHAALHGRLRLLLLRLLLLAE